MTDPKNVKRELARLPDVSDLCEPAGDLFGTNGAAFSECRTWRYLLWRVWDDRRRALMVIALNSSTGSYVKNDPTIRRCTNFAKDWGYGGLYMTNLFGFCTKDPRVLKRAADPIGPVNDAVLLRMADTAGGILVAWGTHGTFLDRGDTVRQMLRERGKEVLTLGLTKNRQPTHPLYIPRNRVPIKLEEA